MTDLFTFAEARAARDAGMKQAADHANEMHGDWTERAFSFLCQFARENETFISEDVSDRSKEIGFPQPSTDRAWGSVYRRAVREDIIIQTGTGRSRRRHCSICPRWSSLIYRRHS